MEARDILIWLCYGLVLIFGLWALGRIIVWQVARFMRVWFKIDIIVASVGLFSANGISVRVNDLQSLEIDKVSLKIRPTSRHHFSLHFGDVRIRAERNLSPKQSTSKADDDLTVQQDVKALSESNLPKLWKLIHWLAEHISLNIDALNVMLLNAVVPESLLHLDLSNVYIAGGGKDVVESGIIDQLSKSTTHQVQEVMPHKLLERTSLGLFISVDEVRGKVLKSSKGSDSENTCIVHVTSSLKVGVVASQLKPQLQLEYVGVDLSKLNVELHSAALSPGLLHSNQSQTSTVQDIINFDRQIRSPLIPLRQADNHLADLWPIKAAIMLPSLTQLRVSKIDILIFGDPLPSSSGIMADVHSRYERGINFSVSAVTLSQRKDPDRMVTLSTEGFDNRAGNVEVIELPTGYVRMKIEDFNIATMSKLKLLSLSRVSAETKLTSNCVLSSSLDFTLCYMHFYHKEITYWTELFKLKLSKITQERPRVTFASPTDEGKSKKLACPGSDKMSRKYRTGLSGNSKGEGINSREITPSHNPLLHNRHKRTHSAPNNFYHAEDYYGHGSPKRRPKLVVPKDFTSLVNVFNALGISTVCECTFYEAVIDATLTKTKTSESCTFSFGFDCITMSLDHSANSQDINFMTKLDRLYWKPRSASFKDSLSSADGTGHDGRWATMEETPYHKTDIHEWGTALSLDTLRLHGQATFGPAIGSAGDIINKTPPKSNAFWPRQHIAISTDAKIAGVQVEFSQTACHCIACILACFTEKQSPTKSKSSMLRQSSHATLNKSKRAAGIENLEKYSFSLAFAELEITHINMFLLPSDTTGCVDCVIVRIDSMRSESNVTDRRFNIEGVGVSTVHNPYFSAFATYESGYHKGGTAMKPTSVPWSVRQQQMRVSQYHCVPATDMQPLHAGFSCLDVEYKVINREEPEDEFPSYVRNRIQQKYRRFFNLDSPTHPKCASTDASIKSLSISLNNDRDIVISWSPKLHMLLHHEFLEMYHILWRTSDSAKDGSTTDSLDTSSCHAKTLPDDLSTVREKYSQFQKFETVEEGSSAGDGPKNAADIITPNIVKQVSFHMNSRISFNIALSDNMFVEFLFHPIRYMEVSNVSTINFTKAQVIMDGHEIFTFRNTKIELSLENEKTLQDRSSFSDMVAKSNRTWQFELSYWSCHFPYGYDFAATFDQFVTTFKWVKGLYRKTSHPFRSPKLPPDLRIIVEKFAFELADWDFECRLHDNHELMKDEWKESEKRRNILNQRVADLRKQRGELLPGKKIEELYFKLEEQNTKIYVERCRKFHDSKSTTIFPSSKSHIRSISLPVTTPMRKNASDSGGLADIPEVTKKHSQARSRSFSFISVNGNVKNSAQNNPPLFLWSIQSLSITVLADKSMHGMENAVETLKTVDAVAPFPEMKTEDSDGYDFVTLWCRNIKVSTGRFQCRLRNYPQYLMNIVDWKIWGKLCGAEQKGSELAQRTEYVPLPAPWGNAKVNRNMPALKFYHDLSSDVQTFNMAWGPCWDPAFSQVNLALNLLNRPSIDPSVPMSWWDKARVLFHGRLMMSMDRSSLLQLASLDPYNTTEHLHWDWKTVLMDWTNGNFLFKGDLDIHIRNASKYDDIRFLHLPGLRMEWDIKWLCKDGANPNDHHAVEPRAPDKLQGEATDHDSFSNFRSQNLNLSVSLVVDPTKSECAEGNRNPEILFYSSTLRWLTHFANAINGVTRPVCKGDLFKNHALPKLKLSRHYKTNTLSFKFPSLKMRYWSSYAQQLGVEWHCGEGSITTKFGFKLIPFEGPLVRRSRGDWSLVQGTCELSQTKVYLMKRGTRCSSHEQFVTMDSDSVSQHSNSSSLREEATSGERGSVEANFLFSLSHMSYRLENDFENDSKRRVNSVPPTPSRENRGQFVRDRRKRASQRSRKAPATPRKPPSQHRHHLVVHDLRAMWITDNRDVAFGIYEGYNKAAILKRNLSTKVLKNILLKPNETVEDVGDGSVSSSEGIKSNRSSTTSDYYGPEPISPGEKIMKSANSLLNKLLSETDKRFFVGPEVPEDEEQLNGVSACQMDDVVNQNWRIKFFNCQAMLKGPKTQGYIILTAAEGDLINREHKISWRDAQLTSKSSWMGSLNDMQIFATVDSNVNSSGKTGENVPWLTVTNIERRGPSPGMLDISDLMTGGQAFGGVVADGVSAGSFQLQRIMSRCSCRMYYVGYEFIVDSEETDYGELLPSPTHDHTYHRNPEFGSISEESGDLIGNEKPVNILTVVQPDLEICTNNTQYSMILDIVENLLLYVEPGMRQHWERVDRMRFQLQLTSLDDVARHKDQLARLQDEIRQKLNDIRQLERDLFKVDRMLEKDVGNENLKEESVNLRDTLVREKEILKEDNEELGIIIRCFKELYLKQKTRSSAPSQRSELEKKWEEDAAVARRTEVSFSQVKWHLTDADGQLTIAKFELRNFLYEKVNKSDDAVEHHFELGWLWLQNLLPNSIYADVLKPQGDHGGTNSYTVVGSGSRRLALRALCKVKPPVGGIPIKELLEFDVVPLIIQLTDQFFKRMMTFFFPGKNSDDDDDRVENLHKDNRNASLLGLGGGSASDPIAIKPKPPSPSKQKPSLTSSSQSLSKSVDKETPTSSRKNWRSSRMSEIRDDVDKMKQRAAKNNTFLYIKIPQFPLCVSYKGQKENNFMDIRGFNLTIPMLVYHNMTWTWHDLAMAVKKECTKTLLSQVIKEKFHLGSSRSSHKEPKESKIVGSGVSRSSSTLPASSGLESDSVDGKKEEDKIKMLFGTHLKRSDSARKSLKRGVSMFKKKK